MKPSRYVAHFRNAQYYQNLARSCDQKLLRGGEEMIQALGRYDLEWPNILAGFRWASDYFEQDQAKAELCNAYAEAGIHCLELRQPAGVLLDWSTNGLKAARHLGRSIQEIVHLSNLGLAYEALGQYQMALEALETALELCRTKELSRPEGIIQSNIGGVLYTMGDLIRARDTLEQALVMHQNTQDRRSQSIALSKLGLIAADLGDNHRAILLYEQSLAIARELGDHRY